MSSFNQVPSYLNGLFEGIATEGNREKIRAALEKYASSNERERIALLSQSIIQAGKGIGPILRPFSGQIKVSCKERVQTIKLISKIAENREAIVAGIVKVIHSDMDGFERNRLILSALRLRDSAKTIACCDVISQILRIKVPPHLDQVYGDNITANERIKIFQLLGTVSARENLNLVAQSVSRIISTYLVVGNRERLFECIAGTGALLPANAEINDGETVKMDDDVIPLTMHYLSKLKLGSVIDSDSFHHLHRVIRQISPRDRSDVVNAAFTIIQMDRDAQGSATGDLVNYIHLLSYISTMDADERRSFIEFIRLFIHPRCTGESFFQAVFRLQRIPAESRGWVYSKSRQLIRSDKDEMQADKFAEAILTVKRGEVDQIIWYYDRLFTEHDRVNGGNVGMIENLAAISPEQRKWIVPFITQLPTFQSLHSRVKSQLIYEVGHCSDRSLIQSICAITRDPLWMQRANIGSVMRALRNVPQDQRIDLAISTLRLLHSLNWYLNNDSHYLGALMDAFGAISVENRPMVFSQIQRLAAQAEIGEDLTEIVELIGNYGQYAEQVVTRALLTVNREMHDDDIMEALENAARHIIPRLRFEDGRDEVQLAREGINVHAENRDNITKNALKVLFEKFGNQDDATQDRYFQGFVTFLKKDQRVSRYRELAERALFAPIEPGENFGPLCQGRNCPPVPHFEVKGFPVTGKHLIAALWHYTLQMQDENDRLNAQMSMARALNSSYEGTPPDNLTRVCNQGKTQRLLVAVLQGREPGIVFDEPATQLSAAEASSIFFNIQPNRDIGSLRELLEAGRAFCSQNPLVPKEQFLNLLTEFAMQNGLPDGQSDSVQDDAS